MGEAPTNAIIIIIYQKELTKQEEARSRIDQGNQLLTHLIKEKRGRNLSTLV